jgi:hypothetical protein
MKKTTLEELEKRIEALEKNRIIYVPQYIQPSPIQQHVTCTCNTLGSWCPIHGQKYPFSNPTYC